MLFILAVGQAHGTGVLIVYTPAILQTQESEPQKGQKQPCEKQLLVQRHDRNGREWRLSRVQGLKVERQRQPRVFEHRVRHSDQLIVDG